jgi:hypothetical protein
VACLFSFPCPAFAQPPLLHSPPPKKSLFFSISAHFSCAAKKRSLSVARYHALPPSSSPARLSPSTAPTPMAQVRIWTPPCVFVCSSSHSESPLPTRSRPRVQEADMSAILRRRRPPHHTSSDHARNPLSYTPPCPTGRDCRRDSTHQHWRRQVCPYACALCLASPAHPHPHTAIFIRFRTLSVSPARDPQARSRPGSTISSAQACSATRCPRPRSTVATLEPDGACTQMGFLHAHPACVSVSTSSITPLRTDPSPPCVTCARWA